MTTDQIPLFTFLAPMNVEEEEIELSYEEYIDRIRNKEDCCISIIDDGMLSESRLVKENSEITILPSQLCVHQIKKVIHGEKHLSVVEVLRFAKDKGYKPDGNLIVKSLCYFKDKGRVQ